MSPVETNAMNDRFVTSTTNPYWRPALEALLDLPGDTVDFEALVSEVYTREYCGERDPLEHRRGVGNALYYEVLPALVDAEVVDYDQAVQRIRPNEARIDELLATDGFGPHDGTPFARPTDDVLSD